MNGNSSILVYSYKDEKQEFIDVLLKNCYIDKISGELYCKKCGNLVKINWFRNIAYCGLHIISQIGVENRDELFEIYL